MTEPLPPILRDIQPSSDNLDSQIKEILASSLPEHSLSGETAEDAAVKLDKLRPSEGNDIETFLWALWGTFLKVVKQIPAQDARMGFLVEIVKRLQAFKAGQCDIWNETVELWDHLPLLGPSLREEWNLNPISSPGDDGIDTWIPLNSFMARLHGQAVYSCTAFAIWEFRTAFEQEYSENVLTPAKRDCVLATTSQWILHAGSVLYEQSRKPPELSEAEKRMFKTGNLTDAGPGLNLQRWRFWRERFGVLSEKASEEVKRDVREAIRKMRELEDGEKA